MPQFNKRPGLAVVARVCRAAGGCQLHRGDAAGTVRGKREKAHGYLRFGGDVCNKRESFCRPLTNGVKGSKSATECSAAKRRRKSWSQRCDARSVENMRPYMSSIVY